MKGDHPDAALIIPGNTTPADPGDKQPGPVPEGADEQRWHREADEVRGYAESLPVQPWAKDPRQQSATKYWLRRQETSSRAAPVGGRRGRFADPVDALADRLERVRWSGQDRFTARCPAHEDRSPSLSAARGEKGAVVYCHAGCATEDVLAAVGLTFPDMFPLVT